jgi:hypothetical protein
LSSDTGKEAFRKIGHPLAMKEMAIVPYALLLLTRSFGFSKSLKAMLVENLLFALVGLSITSSPYYSAPADKKVDDERPSSPAPVRRVVSNAVRQLVNNEIDAVHLGEVFNTFFAITTTMTDGPGTAKKLDARHLLERTFNRGGGFVSKEACEKVIDALVEIAVISAVRGRPDSPIESTIGQAFIGLCSTKLGPNSKVAYLAQRLPALKKCLLLDYIPSHSAGPVPPVDAPQKTEKPPAKRRLQAAEKAKDKRAR